VETAVSVNMPTCWVPVNMSTNQLGADQPRPRAAAAEGSKGMCVCVVRQSNVLDADQSSGHVDQAVGNQVRTNPPVSLLSQRVMSAKEEEGRAVSEGQQS
jgi:hypothetical protein